MSHLMTTLDQIGVRLWILHVDAHHLIPPVGDGHKAGIKRRSQLGDDLRQRIAKILVFSSAKVVPLHDHAAAEMAVVRLECGEDITLFWPQYPGKHRIPVLI